MIIKSILDNDLYKFTMQQAVLELFPNTKVKYCFFNRDFDKVFNQQFLKKLKKEIKNLEKLSLTDTEYNFLKKQCPFLKPQYLEFLKNYTYDSNEINVSLNEDNSLKLTINGYWYSTILWEVPLLSLISELYYKYVKKESYLSQKDILLSQEDISYDKIHKLTINKCKFADFGTRRRRSYKFHNNLISIFTKYCDQHKKNKNYFVGTSNVHLAQKYNLKPIGTYAHEWVMGNSILESLRHANYFAMNNWIKVYNTRLGITLTDTYGTNAFLNNFDRKMAMMYDGVRHDSGSPFEFADKIVNHYKTLNINPKSKTIIFSDGLNPQKAIEIKRYCKDKINCSFGIGTNFTNCFLDALNIVIKLTHVQYDNKYIPVVKLSDDNGKVTGERTAVDIAQWICK
ncbi:MAG: nicotinate phosphoribosyltransferase [archaeon]